MIELLTHRLYILITVMYILQIAVWLRISFEIIQISSQIVKIRMTQLWIELIWPI